jgi:hypothetical protein
MEHASATKRQKIQKTGDWKTRAQGSKVPLVEASDDAPEACVGAIAPAPIVAAMAPAPVVGAIAPASIVGAVALVKSFCSAFDAAPTFNKVSILYI